MKKILVLALIGIMVFSMTAWGAEPATGSDTDESSETAGFFGDSDAVDQAMELMEAEDYDAAVSILQEAADEGDAYALFLLGMCYEDGSIVEQDLEKAAELYQEALAAGYYPDEEDVARLTEVLGEGYEELLAPAAQDIAVVQLTIDGKQVEATVAEDEDGSFTVTYEDEDGEHSFSGGGMAEGEDGTMRPITMEEYIEYLESDIDTVEYEEGTSFEDIINMISESGYDINALFDQIADLVEIFMNDGETETAGNIIHAVGHLINTIINGEDTGAASSELVRDLILDEDSLSQLSSGTILDIYETSRDELIQRGIIAAE